MDEIAHIHKAMATRQSCIFPLEDRGANEGEEKEDRNMASNGHTALRHGDSCQCVIGLPARVCCEAVRVAKNKLPTADLSAPPSQPEERRGEQNGDLST
ncbi:uncharacterized [Tachysurus ichikawai]